MRNFNGIVGSESNIKTGTNPPFTLEDFYGVYPQFKQDIIPEIVKLMYLDLANASIKEARWNNYWKVGMCYFLAHFCTLYLQGVADPSSGAAGVLEAGKAKGLDTSISVGDVSVSTDYGAIVDGIEGWASWKLTTYGQQLATIGRLLGKGGMYIH